MNMHTKAMLATLMAGAFTAPVFAQSTGAYSDLWLGNLSPGTYTAGVADDMFSPGYFSRTVTFGLYQDSEATATVSGMGGGTAVLTTRRFNETSGTYEYPVLAREVVTDGVAFKLGRLVDTANVVGISTSSYYLTLTSIMSSNLNTKYGVLLNLQIAAVPEPGTWALMGLGLVGVAVVARRRRTLN
jgi:hypothetical protein